MNCENSETSGPHRLLLNLTDKINLKRSNRYVASSNLSIYYTWKNIKSCTKTREAIKAFGSFKSKITKDKNGNKCRGVARSLQTKHLKGSNSLQ